MDKASLENESNALYTVLCADKTYKTKFKIGDRVETKGYCAIMVIEGIDESYTNWSNQLHWLVVDEDYLLGKRKTTNAEPVADSDITICT